MSIATAMARIEMFSCVKFVERNTTSDFDYVEIGHASNGCFVSPAGYVMGAGIHTLNLQRPTGAGTCIVRNLQKFNF